MNENRTELRKYKIGELIFGVEGPDFTEPEIPGKFRVSEGEPDYLLKVRVVPTLSVPEGPVIRKENHAETYETADGPVTLVRFERDEKPFYRYTENGPETYVELSADYADYYSFPVILSLFRVPERELLSGAAFLHASFISVGDGAVLFTAAKQVGKSTQARLWKEFRGALTVNGDRALLLKKANVWYAAGSPYAGTSKISENVVLPLKAVVVLGRSENGTPEIRRATVKEAAKALFDGCSYNPTKAADLERMLGLSDDLIQSVPFFKLYATISEESVKVLEEAL